MALRPFVGTLVLVCVGAALCAPGVAWADGDDGAKQAVAEKIAVMQAQIDALQAQLNALKQQQAEPETAAAAGADKLAQAEPEASTTEPAPKEATENREAVASADTSSTHTQDNGITVGGAVRFQYSYEDYNSENVRRVGDMDFDIFRLDLHGKVHGIVLDAQWRWFQYMSAIQHAWVGYNFSDQDQLQVGLTRLPFGNQPYNSHNYFFSSNYYLGLEDTQAMGFEYVHAGDDWNVQAAFFKNDSTGGVDGGGSRIDSYTYNVVGVREPGEGIYDAASHDAGTVDTFAARVARNFVAGDDVSGEVGVSALHGGLDDAVSRIGDYSAYALHTNINYKRWNLQAQAAHYQYQTDADADLLVVGAYAFYDTIPAQADSYTLNLRYHLPVEWGPIGALDFYNDYSLVTNKAADLPHTFMNVLGIGLSAGDLYTYFDYVTGRNQPFIGGSMAGDGEVEHRFNINFGFYF